MLDILKGSWGAIKVTATLILYHICRPDESVGLVATFAGSGGFILLIMIRFILPWLLEGYR
jgi:hypothetical protein